MDVVERLTLEAAQADTMLAAEHRHRYEFAARLCEGKRVLDLCCGSGYGAALLAEHALEVVGVDNDAATIDTAQATIGRELENVTFELADAVAFLRGSLGERFDVLVCFEGLEHLQELDQALALLREQVSGGLQLVASLPNDKLFDEPNPFHVTHFGYDEATAAFAEFQDTVMVPQFLAEGSLIVPSGATETEVGISLDGRDEPEYANHFIFCSGFSAEDVEGVHHGRIHATASPAFNSWAEHLKWAMWVLRRENARLARAHLGKAGSAAAASLAAISDRAELAQRAHDAEVRVRELEALLAESPSAAVAPGATVLDMPARLSPPPGTKLGAHRTAVVRRRSPAGEDPNSWEQRRRRAAEVLIPWIEQTVPLAGKTVLEYGCGNAAVSVAFAERAERLIGVDIDQGWIEMANDEVRKRKVKNVELELHSVDSVLDAVAARRGEVDVFLCYAVLEHLTIPERLAVLRLAREVVKRDGAIVVCEAPNRLTYFDHHTAQMPFFHLLPDELALDYYPRSGREDFKGAIDSAGTDGGREAALEAIIRWGRGVSFHEFEVVFGDLQRHVIASSYDPILFPERPVHPDEMMLARYLERWRPDLAPAWSRFWLDVILSPQPIEKRPPFIRPWTAETVASRDVGWTREEDLHLAGPEATLWVELPQPTSRLIVAVMTGVEQLKLFIRPETASVPLLAEASGPEDSVRYCEVPLPEPARRIAISTSEASRVLFVGYEE